MNRFTARAMQTVIDMAGLSLAYWLAFQVRFDLDVPEQMLKRALFTLPYVVLLQYGLLYILGVTRYAWRYVSLREALRIGTALGAGSATLLSIRLVADFFLQFKSAAQYAFVPGGVVVINFLLALIAINGVRALRRLAGEHQRSRRHQGTAVEKTPTVLIGAGEAGLMVARELRARPDLGILPIGFLDDDPIKIGTMLHGIPVLGNTNALASIVAQTGATQAILTIANAEPQDLRTITLACKGLGLETKIIPGMHELVGGRVNLGHIRDVAIEDVLGREPVSLDEEAIANVVRGRSVMVTGAGGSIGSELCRQICRFGPTRLILVERTENNLFLVHRELLNSFAQATVVPCVADVGDQNRMRSLFNEWRPAVVFHAAAHKHVPMMEWNPAEAVKNNVGGTQVVAQLAIEFEVREFVLISTDKAVNPTSIMGATKRVAELYLQALSQQQRATHFIMVRFGNVLGSAGSVVPLFKEQIARGGPVTVTHPDMQRYFMTIREACQLVLQSASMGLGGEVFILDMGEPMKILDLARVLIQLSGFRPGEDIDISITGMRPGEKLFEELSVDAEQADKTRHEKIFIGRLAKQEWAAIEAPLTTLLRAAAAEDEPAVRAALTALVPEYQGRPNVRRLEPSANSDITGDTGDTSG